MSKYIDADKLTKDLERLCGIVCQYSKKQRDVMCGSCPLGDAFELLDNQLAADVVEVKRGRWESYLNEGLIVKCSVCGSRYVEPWNFCPNCGASMDEEEKNETD